MHQGGEVAVHKSGGDAAHGCRARCRTSKGVGQGTIPIPMLYCRCPPRSAPWLARRGRLTT